MAEPGGRAVLSSRLSGQYQLATVLGGVPRRYSYSQNGYERLCAGAAKARAIRAAKREAGIPETRVERRVGILEARVARLEAKLTAAEREWAKNPKKYADLLAMETSETNIREEARYSTSEWGVKFRLMGDGLDDWRLRFLGSQREVGRTPWQP